MFDFTCYHEDKPAGVQAVMCIWNDSEYSTIDPDEFIETAKRVEAYGLTGSLTLTFYVCFPPSRRVRGFCESDIREMIADLNSRHNK